MGSLRKRRRFSRTPRRKQLESSRHNSFSSRRNNRVVPFFSVPSPRERYLRSGRGLPEAAGPSTSPERAWPRSRCSTWTGTGSSGSRVPILFPLAFLLSRLLSVPRTPGTRGSSCDTGTIPRRNGNPCPTIYYPVVSRFKVSFRIPGSASAVNRFDLLHPLFSDNCIAQCVSRRKTTNSATGRMLMNSEIKSTGGRVRMARWRSSQDLRYPFRYDVFFRS